ncbi:MAG: mycothiol system anti-sigma-R factor [Pseudonocardiales bacterium]|jgi:mycothiol system anti-sigma-R factor|nr:mycothiol system anti-sigma-R factor [Pseudonocardiales bacterium]
MSSGDPRDTDCHEVLEQLWLLLDNECDHERRELLQRHLDDCGPCLERFGLEEHLKALLARKCGGDHAPDALRQRLLQSIREIMSQAVSGVEVSSSTESHVWLSTEC